MTVHKLASSKSECGRRGGGLGRPKYNKQADSHWDRALALAVPVKQHKSDKTAAARAGPQPASEALHRPLDVRQP